MPDQEAESSRSKLPWYRRPWIVMGGMVLLALGGLGYVYFKDDPPSDDSDLMPSPMPTADEDNPLAVFCREMSKYKLDDWSRVVARDVKQLSREDDAKLEAFLKSHTAEQELFESLMRSDPKSWRWPGVDASLSSKTDIGYLSTCVGYAGRVARAKVLRLAWAGNHQEASEEALKVVRFGEGLLGADGPMIHLLIATATQELGKQLVKAAVIDATDMSLLAEIQATLAPLGMLPSQMARVLRVEYLFGKNSPEPTAEEWEAMGYDAQSRLAMKYLMLQNRTRAEYAQRFRLLIHGLELGWPAALQVHNEIKATYDYRSTPMWKVVLAPNLGGRMLLKRTWGSMSGMVGKYSSAEAVRRMTVVMLALRRFEGKHGRTPATLQELVPEFLPAVPIDPFDGKPLRWLEKKRWLYSIGQDGVDDRGEHRTEERTTLLDQDLVMPYWWLPEERERK